MVLFLVLCLLTAPRAAFSAALLITEVADKGTSNACPSDQDWVEIHNPGPGDVNLTGWKLHDDKGPNDNKAFTFMAGTSITTLSASAYVVLCTKLDDAATSPQFGIGGDDTVSLIDATGTLVSTSGVLQDQGGYNLTWALDSNSGTYRYTATPTPGASNVITSPRAASASLLITEVADKGTSNACPSDQDWVEIHNPGPGDVNLTGWKLHDDKGPNDNKAFTFTAGTSITTLSASAYVVLCTKLDDATTSPQFGIGGDDTVSLIDATGTLVSTSGVLQDQGGYNLTWALDSNSGTYRYTATPTPGASNVITSPRAASASLLITEVADKGTSNACPSDQDWVEIHNPGPGDVNLTGWKLHDDKGPNDNKAFTFTAGTSITTLSASAYVVLCTKLDDATTSPQFGIGGDDTVSLIDATGTLVSTSGVLQDQGGYNLTWALDSNSGTYRYTATPTPGASNVFTESWPHVRSRLEKQHTDGESFFDDAETGAVVDLYLGLSAADWAYQQPAANASYENYRPFHTLSVKRSLGGSTLATLPLGGRMRPRGQSTMAIPICTGSSALPYLIDVTSESKQQRLFGMERFYLRNHLSDGSAMREWTMHRMLRRFGLPYLRNRIARLFINDSYQGTYTLMEAPDQEYVFYRSFGDKAQVVDRPPLADSHALYKVKTMSLGCGTYSQLEVAQASPPIYTAPTDPSEYAFKRGAHRQKIPVLGGLRWQECINVFYVMIGRERRDTIAAWLKADKNCGKMLVSEGIVDRDLGSGAGGGGNGGGNDARMERFLNTYLSGAAASGCANGAKCAATVSTLRDVVDVDDFLKNFAVYAVTLGQDSPLGNGNNYFLASPGGATEQSRAYRIVQYDHNNAAEKSGLDLCHRLCAGRAIYWSITRPTCRSLASNPLVGPLLAGTNATANADNMRTYLGYVRDFNKAVYTNATFIAEAQAHAAAIESAVKQDFFLQYVDYSRERTVAAGTWGDFNLLAFMKARGEEVDKQLAALDAGTFPRLPDKVNPADVCQDWRTEDTGALSLTSGQKTDRTATCVLVCSLVVAALTVMAVLDA